MNGNRVVLDTNAIISLLKGNPVLIELSKKAEWIGISIISYIEFLAFPELSDEDKSLFELFSKRVDVIGLDYSNYLLIQNILTIRKKYRVKLPDAIIIATTLETGSTLVTDDKQLHKIDEIITIMTV